MQAYFSRTDHYRIQYKLLGTYAHLNGALWQALSQSFTQAEMEVLKKEFVFFKRSLNRTYTLVYKEAVANSKTANAMRTMGLGLSRIIGNYYLYKRRKKTDEISQALLERSLRHESLLKKVDSKK